MSDLLPPVDPPPAPPAVAPSPHRQVTCECCGCLLTGGGEIIKMGARAKAMRTTEERVEALTAERDSVARQLAAAQEELTAARARDDDDDDDDRV